MRIIAEPWRRRRLAILLAGAAVMTASMAERADAIQYPIVSDAQIDSRDPTYNFGASGSAKVVVNGQDGSLARSVFDIPDEVWSTSGIIESVKVYFYLWDDTLKGRNVQLSPLIRPFVQGTGNGYGSGANTGATWLTYDGTRLWTTAGGDFDSSVAVEAAKPEDGWGWFSWDITSLWNESNLRSNGAILKMVDETIPEDGSMPRAPFAAYESTQYPHPYVEVTTTTPEPGSLAMLLAGGVVAAGTVLLRRGRRPGNRRQLGT